MLRVNLQDYLGKKKKRRILMGVGLLEREGGRPGFHKKRPRVAPCQAASTDSSQDTAESVSQHGATSGRIYLRKCKTLQRS